MFEQTIVLVSRPKHRACFHCAACRYAGWAGECVQHLCATTVQPHELIGDVALSWSSACFVLKWWSSSFLGCVTLEVCQIQKWQCPQKQNLHCIAVQLAHFNQVSRKLLGDLTLCTRLNISHTCRACSIMHLFEQKKKIP